MPANCACAVSTAACTLRGSVMPTSRNRKPLKNAAPSVCPRSTSRVSLMWSWIVSIVAFGSCRARVAHERAGGDEVGAREASDLAAEVVHQHRPHDGVDHRGEAVVVLPRVA